MFNSLYRVMMGISLLTFPFCWWPQSLTRSPGPVSHCVDSGGTHISAARSQPYYLDVTHPQANKGGMVLAMSKMLTIPPQTVSPIGAIPHHVLMFSNNGL